MANTITGSLNMHECIAIVILAIDEISEVTNLSVQTVFNCFAQSVVGLSDNPTDEEYIQAAVTLRRLLQNGGVSHG